MIRKERNSTVPLLVTSLLLLVVSAEGCSEAVAQQSSQLKAVGKIVGRVRLEGPFERPPPLEVYKNRGFCGSEVPNESFIVGADGGVQNVVITIRGAGSEKPVSPSKNLVLDNKKCAFVPHVQVVPVGSQMLLLNSDLILHDVHARIGSETLFNIGLPSWRQVKKRLTRPGVVAIECEVLHTWMSAYIVVTSSPNFAVTDQMGEFVIEAVPVGTYEMQIWHEKLGGQSKTVNIRANHTVRVDIAYRLGEEGS